MSGDMNKNEDATPYKLSEARKKGQVAKSSELSSFASLLAMIITILATLTAFLEYITFHTSWWLNNAHLMINDNVLLWDNITTFMSGSSSYVMAIIIAGVISTIVITVVHIGPLLTFFPLKPDFSKLNPVTGLKKIFSKKTLVDLMRLVLKLIAFPCFAYLSLEHVFSNLVSSQYTSLNYIMHIWEELLILLCLSMLVCFLLFTVFDLWYSKRYFHNEMKMSKNEVKDERKRQDGDPEIKAKRKKILQELLSSASSSKNVKDSDVIITNPSHVAVALMYRPETMALPIVVAKGRGFVAAEIRRLAKKNGIPIVRKPELARLLLKSIKIGNPIDSKYQKKVADIYRWVVTFENNKVIKQ